MTKISERDKLLRLVRGENLDNVVRYYIEFSVDIRGKITIWGGMDYLPEEALPMFDNPKNRVERNIVPLYEYYREYPYTARIYQMEQEISETISDETLIEEYNRFRQAHQEDGFGMRFLIVHIGEKWCKKGEEPDEGVLRLRPDRDDKQEVFDRLLKQEREDIRKLWGVDCPPDINLGDNWSRRLDEGKGLTSDWFKQEFTRIGGNYQKLWRR